jgi:hypothetical protein
MLAKIGGRGRMRLFALCLLLLSTSELVIRGPIRFAHARDFNDFISPYIQTRAWIKGADPYSSRNLVALWPAGAERPWFLEKDLANGSLVTKRGIPTAYPPTAFPLLSLFAWLPWTVAHGAWLVTSLLVSLLGVVCLAARAGFNWQTSETCLFLAFAFALAPFHTGLAAGTIVVVVVGLCAVALWEMGRGHPLAAGLWIAVAVGLKPQIGLPFLAYFILRRYWGIVVPALVCLLGLASVAFIRFAVAGVPWVNSYLYDNKILLGYGSLGDFTEANPIRFGLINLQVLTYAFCGDRMIANLAALAITALLGVAWLFFFSRRSNDERNDLLEVGTLAVLSLLPVYHRFYDATLLIFPLAWAWTAWQGPLRAQARATVMLMLVFLVPGGAALEQFRHTGHIQSLQHSWVWGTFIMPHEIWSLILLACILLNAMRARATLHRQ